MTVKIDKFAEFTSSLGMRFVAPSQFTGSEQDTTLTIASPDGHAVIQAMVFTAEGSGTLTDFREMLTANLSPDSVAEWQPSDWIACQVGQNKAWRRDLMPLPASGSEWQVFVMQIDEYYYAIILHATEVALRLNATLYEHVVQSFRGIPSTTDQKR